MSNDLIPDVTALGHLPGAPFTQEEVDAAVASLRAEVGWHVAPVRAETVALDVTRGERWLRIPTAKLLTVVEVRDMTGALPVAFLPTDYTVSRKLAQVQREWAYWPAGFEAVEVDVTHGYESVPLDLLEVVAGMASGGRGGLGGVSQVTSGAHSVSFEPSSVATVTALDRYRILDFGFA